MRLKLFLAILALSFPGWTRANADFGLDLNVPSALMGVASNEAYISGTLSAASSTSRYEIAVPFFFNEHTFNSDVCCIVEIVRFDLQLRRFSDSQRQGLYYGVIVRRSNVSGRDYLDNSRPASYTRYGIGTVVGFKTKFGNRIFWGTNLNIGRFLSDGEYLADGSLDATFFGPTDNGAKNFFNIEFLKLGIRF